MLQSKKKSNSIIPTCFLIYCFITSTVYFLPYTKFVVPYYIAGLLMLVSLAFLFMKSNRTHLYICVLMICSMILMLICMNSFVTGLNEMIRNVRFYMTCLWALYVIDNCTDKQKKYFLFFFALVIVYILYRTNSALNEEPWIVRMLAEDKANSTAGLNSYRLANVGGFEFAYAIGIVTLIFVYTFIHSKKLYIKILALIASILLFLFVTKTMYATLFILVVLGVFLLFALNCKNTVVKVLLVIIGIVLAFNLKPILYYTSVILPDRSLLSDKFYGMYQTLLTGNASYMSSRPEKMLEGLQIWAQHPIFGVGGEESISHSTIIGTLSNFGIVGFSIFVTLMEYTRRIIVKALRRNNTSTALFTVSYLFLLVLSLLNPVGYVFEVVIMVFFIVPVFSTFFAQSDA